jgi:hypothetical protein
MSSPYTTGHGAWWTHAAHINCVPPSRAHLVPSPASPWLTVHRVLNPGLLALFPQALSVPNDLSPLPSLSRFCHQWARQHHKPHALTGTAHPSPTGDTGQEQCQKKRLKKRTHQHQHRPKSGRRKRRGKPRQPR